MGKNKIPHSVEGSRRIERDFLTNLNDKLEKCYFLINSAPVESEFKKYFAQEKTKDGLYRFFFHKRGNVYAIPFSGQAHLCNLSLTHYPESGEPCFMSYIGKDMLDEIISLAKEQ